MLIVFIPMQAEAVAKRGTRYTLENKKRNVLADYKTRKEALEGLRLVEAVTGKKHNVYGHMTPKNSTKMQTWRSA